MIVTWLADVSALQEESTYRRYYEQVPTFRKEKADKLRMQEDKAQSVGAWILYEMMKKEYCLQGNEIFNISHSGDYVMCSAACYPSCERESNKCEQLGCDLEKVLLDRFAYRGSAASDGGTGKESTCMTMARRFFCEEECEQIRSIEDFYRFWVLKESVQKATRLGSKLAMNTFSFAFTSEGTPFLQKQPFEKTYYMKEYAVENLLYKIAVCSDVDAFAPEIRIVKL